MTIRISPDQCRTNLQKYTFVKIAKKIRRVRETEGYSAQNRASREN